MLLVLLAFINISCQEPKIINISKYPLVKFDYEILEQAKNKCSKLYKDSPCVKVFKKYDFQSYSVICGQNK